MRRLRFSPRSSFARTLLLIVTLLFVSLVTTYLVVLNFAILPSLQLQFVGHQHTHFVREDFIKL
ncbi:hypothetical protein, partial [Escherichia coli]|uniref:hypothetical protein n=1 Tax=Escherichia coli TaxID=562 RepID=UPI002026C3EC